MERIDHASATGNSKPCVAVALQRIVGPFPLDERSDPVRVVAPVGDHHAVPDEGQIKYDNRSSANRRRWKLGS